MQHPINLYNEYAAQHAKLVIAREEAGVENDPIMPCFLEMLGDGSGLVTAKVTGIDVAENLV